MAKTFKSKPFAFLLAISIIFSLQIEAQINFSLQSQYKYLKGSEAAGLSSNWINVGFSDASWTTGNAPFRYGDGVGGTELSDMMYVQNVQNGYSTLYLRTTFNASNVGFINEIALTINYDDGFVVWINGEEVLSQYAPAILSYNSFATTNHESGTGELFVINSSDFDLVEGENIIAVQGFNISLTSTDFYFDMSMNAEIGIPELIDTVGISFSEPSGFYDTPFNLTLSSPDPTANIIYTLDGSNPQTSLTSYTVGTSVSIPINPESAVGRGLTPGVVVRASITKTGYKPSKPNLGTYIFLDKVKTQSYPGGAWPNGTVNTQFIYYEMDPAVVNDIRYSSNIDDALLDIPSISIVTDLANLFDPASGIYVNALGHGLDWERECSVELINPDGSEGFNTNAGLRIRGGWSRHDYPKHAFRLFFREKYGDAKLNYPLFGDEGVSEFDKIDLRCEMNYAWSLGDPRNTCVREIFSRDTQRDMDQPYTRSRYYHLYIDGVYWGLYQTQERSEARYAADYMGANAEDYDVIKVNTDGYQIEATDGNENSWRTLWNMCNKGFSSDSAYFRLEGRDKNGSPAKNSSILVDIDNLIDFMLVIFYTGNFDSPTSSFGNNKGPNNFYAIYNRNDKSKGFTFFAHDAEHSLFTENVSPGIGLYENRVNIADRTDDMKMLVTNFYSFHPQWLHYKLSENAEYRMRFADRAYMCLNEGGALTSSEARLRLDKRVSEIETAIIAESARWGGLQPWTGVAYTKDDNWLLEIQKIRNSFFPSRTNIVINQLKQENLYTNLNPPAIKKSGIAIQGDHYFLSTNITVELSNPNAEGSTYYTLNGTDPRLVGGNISSDAIKIEGSSSLLINNSTILKARVYNDGSWSAIKHIDFLSQNEDFSQLKVTELNYNPIDLIVGIDTTAGKDFEFIEFKNTGETSINLTGLVLDSAVYFTFPFDDILGPKQFYVVASKPSKFYERYGIEASGNFSGNFSNGGEQVLLADGNGDAVINFTYDDHSPWPDRADGLGYTMVSMDFNPTGDPNDPFYWRTSLLKNGSPFKDDDGSTGIETPEFITQGDISVYPNPSNEFIVVTVKSADEYGRVDIKLYNINGMQVYQSTGKDKTTINLRDLGLKAGLYIIQTETTNFVETAKIIYSPK